MRHEAITIDNKQLTRIGLFQFFDKSFGRFAFTVLFVCAITVLADLAREKPSISVQMPYLAAILAINA